MTSRKSHIIAIGTGAGACESLNCFLTGVPSDFQDSFVIFQDPSPDSRRLEAELLSQNLRLPVRVVEKNLEPEAGCVYLVPPRINSTIEQGRFCLGDEPVAPDLNRPFDAFLVSLAKDQGAQAIAIILSGLRIDELRGLRSIKEAGGMVMVETSSSNQIEGFPETAGDAGLIDCVGTVEQLLHELAKFPGRRSNREDETPLEEALQQAREELERTTRELQMVRAEYEDKLSTAATELRRVQDQLQSKDAELKQFAYVTSHDLREPLRTLTSFSGILLSKNSTDPDPDSAMALQFIQSASQRMSDMISGLLKYSRLDDGANLELEEIDCNRLVKEVIDDLGHDIRKSDAQIDLKTELPTVRGTDTGLRVVFQNLISNAIKFQPENQAPLISIDAVKDAKFWTISVSDNGIGFDSDKQQEKIFQIFQRLNPADAFEGTGVGLASCKKIIEIHGGEIEAESTPGAGSTFSFTVPLNEGLEAET